MILLVYFFINLENMLSTLVPRNMPVVISKYWQNLSRQFDRRLIIITSYKIGQSVRDNGVKLELFVFLFDFGQILTATATGGQFVQVIVFLLGEL